MTRRKPLRVVPGGKPGPPNTKKVGAPSAPDRCVTCDRKVDPAFPIFHELTGSHTCRAADGTAAVYIDPNKPEEHEARAAYLDARRKASNPS